MIGLPWAGPEPVWGQEASPAGVPAEEDALTVYLVTAAPGDAIWERFGHNGLWIQDRASGQDIFWEWGLFSFSQQGFIPRLAKGTMLYGMGGRYLEDMLALYRAQDRPVWAQELALTSEQERALNRAVRINALPENAQYVYDYYTDNCSTRARDALDAVLGGQVRAAFDTVATGTTWRWHTRRLLRPDPLAEAGIQIVLGNPGDAEISAWEEMFLPMRMRDHLSGATVRGPGGEERPLVVREIQLLESSRSPEPAAPANRLPAALLLGLLSAATVAVLGGWGAGGSRPGTRIFGGALAAWSLLTGILGTVLLVAWAFTDHDFWGWNENLLQLSPLSLAIAILAFPLLAGRPPGRRLRTLLGWVAALSAAAVALKVLPGVDQGNWEVVVVALPVHVAFTWSAARFPGPAS